VLQEKDCQVIVSLCQQFHKAVQTATSSFATELGRQTYVTPTSYLELITLFQSLLTKKLADNVHLSSRYCVGLEKLMASGAAVAGMQAELTNLQPQLVKTVAEVKALMAQIAADKQNVVEPKAEVRSLVFLHHFYVNHG
jgi:dynein heavy chain, axonemal